MGADGGADEGADGEKGRKERWEGELWLECKMNKKKFKSYLLSCTGHSTSLSVLSFVALTIFFFFLLVLRIEPGIFHKPHKYYNTTVCP